MLKTLLLNASYDTISFLNERKAIRLVVKEKVDIVACWNEHLVWGSGSIRHPAIIKLKNYVKRTPVRLKFNRRGVFRRDFFSCQYCGVLLPISKLTLDHIIPRAQGGRSTWQNTVSCCLPCNLKKADKTLEEAGMKLIRPPATPERSLSTEFLITKPKHIEWHNFFQDVAEYVEYYSQIGS